MSISITKSLNTATVPVSVGLVGDSSRSINPYNTVCYNWDGTDASGREASHNTVAIRTGGCTSALTQMLPEAANRPQYVGFLNGGGSGIQGSQVNTGLNQVTGTLQLAASNPQSLPGLALPGDSASAAAQPIMSVPSGASHIAPAENFQSVSFGTTMPVKMIHGTSYEGYTSNAKGTGFNVGMNKAVRHTEAFTKPNSYVLADRKAEHFQGNSYVLANKQAAIKQATEHYTVPPNTPMIHGYAQSAKRTGSFEGFTFATQLMRTPMEGEHFGQSLATPHESYAPDNLAKLTQARYTSAMKKSFGGKQESYCGKDMAGVC